MKLERAMAMVAGIAPDKADMLWDVEGWSPGCNTALAVARCFAEDPRSIVAAQNVLAILAADRIPAGWAQHMPSNELDTKPNDGMRLIWAYLTGGAAIYWTGTRWTGDAERVATFNDAAALEQHKLALASAACLELDSVVTISFVGRVIDRRPERRRT